MLDLIAFLGARAGTVALNNLAALADSHVTVNGNNILVPDQCCRILALTAVSEATAGSLTNQIRISSPSLAAASLIDLDSWNANGAVVAANQIPDNNCPYADWKESPIMLQPGEALQVLTAVDVAAVAENVIVPIILTDGVIGLPPVLYGARMESVIFDVGSPAIANTWTPAALTPRQALRAGSYVVVGMKFTGTTNVCARLIFGNQGPRPGCVGTNSAVGAAGVGSFSDSVDQMDGLFRRGRLGVWGVFSTPNYPNVEILSSVADAAIAQHVTLDLIKIN